MTIDEAIDAVDAARAALDDAEEDERVALLKRDKYPSDDEPYNREAELRLIGAAEDAAKATRQRQLDLLDALLDYHRLTRPEFRAPSIQDPGPPCPATRREGAWRAA